MGKLEHIWIKRAKQGPMDAKEHASLIVGRGLVDNANQGGKRQVTIIERDAWADACRELNATVTPTSRRANLMVSGLSLAESRGKILKVGNCRLRIAGETRPCELMDAMHPGLRNALKPEWRGGAYAEVLNDSEIAIGDLVEWIEDETAL